MKQRICLFFLLFSPILLSAQKTPIKVYLLGTFHFNQTDTNVYDVRSDRHQQSIQQLADKILAVHPDKVFIERMPEWEDQNHIDSLYQVYRKGGLRQARNEIWQVGGRVAAALNHQHIYQCDQPGMYGYHLGQIEEYSHLHHQDSLLSYKGKGMTNPEVPGFNSDSLRMSLSLLGYLQWLNSADVQKTSHAHYINTYPQMGNTNVFSYDSTYFLGANLTIDWYRRNILIYSKMLAQLDYSEKAIFLIIGNDHIPIIRQLFRDNPFFEVVDTDQWLGSSPLFGNRH